MPNIFSSNVTRTQLITKTFTRKSQLNIIKTYFISYHFFLLSYEDIKANSGPMPNLLQTHPQKTPNNILPTQHNKTPTMLANHFSKPHITYTYKQHSHSHT